MSARRPSPIPSAGGGSGVRRRAGIGLLVLASAIGALVLGPIGVPVLPSSHRAPATLPAGEEGSACAASRQCSPDGQDAAAFPDGGAGALSGTASGSLPAAPPQAPAPLSTAAPVPAGQTTATASRPAVQGGQASGSATASSAPRSPQASLSATAGRPFSSDSVWNTPIRSTPAGEPNSAAMVARITPGGRAYANLYAYGTPIYTADPSAPPATVHCTMPWGTCDLERRSIRIPVGARPATGSDGQLVVVDFAARTSCDFWQARQLAPGRWTTSWATCASLDGDGTGRSGGSTGAGINTLAGVIRTFEVRAGEIPHAVSVATSNSCADPHRLPAVKSDGSSTRPDCIPEGARLQLDPGVDVDSIPGITPGERAVARALQVYGAINRDNSAAPLSVSFEDPAGKADPYAGSGLPWDYFDMPHIPWTRLRVLR